MNELPTFSLPLQPVGREFHKRWNDVPRVTPAEVSSHVRLECRSFDGRPQQRLLDLNRHSS